ncbi:ATP synthase subunit s, mitochondrial-like isoform X2 [Dreissena polymorpha]|uniref:ATP synthase subunit s, mitochondrial n=1 Tax=Dreissena polymorpha TaxID=45954 RepID=A0A9D4RPZ6_DREPO|nr:ATP synthase subunit s, mitochondrial-like isoform X2 [Dreissena polymorpha]KAH3874963.1 hypothetical protein DPMN_038221 [Dreissena polymorpha]
MLRSISTLIKRGQQFKSTVPGLASVTATGRYVQCRQFMKMLDSILNLLDSKRLDVVGPDRLCAEWILKTGGRVRWAGSDTWLQDFNFLPPEDFEVKLQDVDATECAIMIRGFEHFKNCKHIRSMKFHGCKYLTDDCLAMLWELNDSLRQLQVSGNKSISDKGILYLTGLTNLTALHLKDLPGVKNKPFCYGELKKQLPKCDIVYMDVVQ